MNPGRVTNVDAYFSEDYGEKRKHGELASLEASALHFLNSKLMKTLNRPARLVKPNKSSRDQRWYIKYWPLDVLINKHILKRIYDLPKHSDPITKEKLCWEYCADLDEMLKDGFVIDSRTPKKTIRTSLNLLIDEYVSTRTNLKPRSILAISGSMEKFKIYLKKIQLHTKSPDKFTANDALKYQNYLIASGISNRSINNDLSYVKTFFNSTKSLYPDYLKDNPFKELKKLKESGGRNTAYLPDQVTQIVSFQKNRFPDLDFLSKFMYYTLMRTNEISKLQVKHIGMYHPNQIYVMPELSKNSHGRHVVISEQLEELLQQHNIRSFPADFYVFGFKESGKHKVRGKFCPSEKPTNSRYLGSKYREQILNKLDFSKDYTLYSWKHTGVVNAKLAGISDADIMQQTGHRSYDSYQKYLKSLGLFVTGEYANKVPTI